MRTVSLITLSILICACSANKKNLPDGIEIIPVEVDKVSQDASSFLEKIEIVPLRPTTHLSFINVIKSSTIKVRIYLQFIQVIKLFSRFREMGNI